MRKFKILNEGGLVQIGIQNREGNWGKFSKMGNILEIPDVQ